MADGFKCKHCGCSETEHRIMRGEYEGLEHELDEPTKCKRGYRLALSKCRRFTLNKKDRVTNRKIQKNFRAEQREQNQVLWNRSNRFGN